MATLVLSAAGLAVGGSLGGSVLGMSTGLVGRAVGASIGRSIDARLLGSGSAPVEVGRIDRLRLTGASEGAPVADIHGRMRVAGQVIWASPFEEIASTSGGGKFGGPRTTDYAYRVSLALALCRGEITRVGRVWADGDEIDPGLLSMRVYPGDEAQLPDPRIVAESGEGLAPGYRGIAYVVIEDLDLGLYGNRVPHFTFEVFRPGAIDDPAEAEDMARLVRGVAMIPGTGEYSLATTPVHMDRGFGDREAANVNTVRAASDLVVSLDALEEELPNCGSVVLVVSWFGDDLRCGTCQIRPKVEQVEVDGAEMAWSVSGLGRAAADVVARLEGRPVYGGTPSDRAVIEAITEMRERGLDVVFYPFILMEQMAGNTLPNPWTGTPGQPPLPWRGRITTSLAPGLSGTPDRTAAAEAEVAAFFGQAGVADFIPGPDGVGYVGPQEWSFRRFILHYARLCAIAGGVDAFCIGSEMVALTQIRGAGDGFPAVAALRALAADVRAILGPGTRISYAADWSEYHGYQPEGTGDKYFHLDPLWADPAIDFVGIDNYMPLSDWREGEVHADAGWGSIHDLDYLTGNVAGGEGYDWYYASPEAREAQIRTPISDFWGEPWVWRYKDIKGWWSNRHHDRIGGVRAANPTDWEPGAKPIWFTEFGCAAIDKGTNQPNKFLDPKSSESFMPYFSTGARDDYIQIQYLRAVHRHFADAVNNPLSETYQGPMVDMSRAHVWAWDARPWPAFPTNRSIWADGDNYTRGHWINGRTTARPLASVAAEICREAGVTAIDTRRLHGLVRGFRVEDTASPRAALQALMLAYGFDAVERDGRLVFVSRSADVVADLNPGTLVLDGERETALALVRASSAERVGRVRLTHVDAETEYVPRSVEARFADDPGTAATDDELPLVLTREEGRAIAERWLAEARIARDAVSFALPPSAAALGVGDVVRLPVDGGGQRYRIERVDLMGHQAVDAVRVDPETYRPQPWKDEAVARGPLLRSGAAEALFLDLPLLSGDEAPHAPHLALTSRRWTGPAALYDSVDGGDRRLTGVWPQAATVGLTLAPLPRAAPGLWDEGPALDLRLIRGSLRSRSEAEVLAGGNLCAIGNGTTDGWEVFQFVHADLIAPDTWRLRRRLRGQAGSDGVLPDVWPAGSFVVLLDDAVRQIAVSPALRGQERIWRWGPAQLPPDHQSFREASLAFAGIGLRPYSVCHLRRLPAPGQQHRFGWIRRTRIDGDPWGVGEVPLGEEREEYLIRVLADGIVRREQVVATSPWIYGAAARLADGVTGAYRVEVAQVSASFGAGPVRGIEVPG